MDSVNVIYTDYGNGQWAVTSPQTIGLLTAYSGPAEAQRDLPSLLTSAGLDPSTCIIKSHEEHYAVSPSGHEFLVRFSVSETAWQAASRIRQSIQQNDIGDLLSIPALETGERLIVCVEPEATFAEIDSQIPNGSAVVVVYYGGNDAIYHVTYADDGVFGHGNSLRDLGLDQDSTIAEAFDSMLSREVTNLSWDVEAEALLRHRPVITVA